jgi:hypothetical protein
MLICHQETFSGFGYQRHLALAKASCLVVLRKYRGLPKAVLVMLLLLLDHSFEQCFPRFGQVLPQVFVLCDAAWRRLC